MRMGRGREGRGARGKAGVTGGGRSRRHEAAALTAARSRAGWLLGTSWPPGMPWP